MVALHLQEGLQHQHSMQIVLRLLRLLCAVCPAACCQGTGRRHAVAAGAAGSSPPPLEVDPSPAARPPFPPLPMLVRPPCPDAVTCCRQRLPAITQKCRCTQVVVQVGNLTAVAGHWTLTRGLPVATPKCMARLPAATQAVHASSWTVSGACWMMPRGAPKSLNQPYRRLQRTAAAQAVLDSKHCHPMLTVH